MINSFISHHCLCVSCLWHLNDRSTSSRSIREEAHNNSSYGAGKGKPQDRGVCLSHSAPRSPIVKQCCGIIGGLFVPIELEFACPEKLSMPRVEQVPDGRMVPTISNLERSSESLDGGSISTSWYIWWWWIGTYNWSSGNQKCSDSINYYKVYALKFLDKTGANSIKSIAKGESTTKCTKDQKRWRMSRSISDD